MRKVPGYSPKHRKPRRACILRAEARQTTQPKGTKMIKAILFATTAIFATQIHAEAFPPNVCAAMETMTYQFAMARMNGAPLAKTMAIADASSPDPAVQELIRQIILGAYALPIMMTDKNKASVATEYAAKVALMCYNAK